MKIPNKRELQEIVLNHSSYIDFKDVMKICKKCTAEPYSFLVNDTTLPSDSDSAPISSLVLKVHYIFLNVYITAIYSFRRCGKSYLIYKSL